MPSFEIDIYFVLGHCSVIVSRDPSLIVHCLGYLVTRHLMLLAKGTHRSRVGAYLKITRHWFATLAGNNDMSFFLLFELLFEVVEYNFFFMAFIVMVTNEMKSW